MSPEEILAQARSASAQAKRNLDAGRHQVRVGFLRKKEKGDIAFAVTEDQGRVKTEVAVETKEPSWRDQLLKSSRLTPCTKLLTVSTTTPSLPLKEETLKEEAFDLFDNRRRFVKEMSASLKPKEKPIDKVGFRS